MRAIISVSDKTGVNDFGNKLHKLGYEIYSTGGTKKALADAGIPVKSITEMTGFPEILDGRVKTLHPSVHGGILARRDLPAHMSELLKHNIETIDLVAVNLYPFMQTVAKDGVTLTDALENIDIGGPTLIRASAKNFPGVIVVVDPNDYNIIIEKLKSGSLSLADRQRLARKAFQHVALYDTAISQYLKEDRFEFTDELTIGMKKRYTLRYGENPHQTAAFYSDVSVEKERDTGITFAEILNGKELSFNNILDADAAWGTVVDFSSPVVAIIKHTNPCGLACGEPVLEAYKKALTGDPVAAYGGIVASNRIIDLPAAEEIAKTFYEIIAAPDYTPEALSRLQRKKDLRILKVNLPPAYGKNSAAFLDFRKVAGGVLVQKSDSLTETDDATTLKVVTKRQPTDLEFKDLLFAFRAAKHIKSNAIVLVNNLTLLGMGAGQPSRIVSTKIAAERAGNKAKGSVLASDAMFPFADNVEEAARVGVTAIIQPGGSIRDADSIKAADDANIAMVFTGVRHFRH